MSHEEVLAIARAGAEAGCHEALFTLGDKPELRYKVARDELAALGHETTISYLVEVARLVLEETGLLPHANPGVLTHDDLRALRAVSPSQGIMLESVSERLMAKGAAHHGSPDKHPAARLATLEAAGECQVPFTSGILIGIGETRAERIDALLAIRDLHARHGHIQEVIVQNFRAKAGTKMHAAAEPNLDELLWTTAVARIVLGPSMNIQVPPNLSYADFPRLLAAGINDWGGVSPVTIDHVNPEAPWPELELLREATEDAGFSLAPRLPLYPEYVWDLERWCDPEIRTAVLHRADASGLGREGRWASGAVLDVPPAMLDLTTTPAAERNGRAGHCPDPGVAAVLAKQRQGTELDGDDITTLFESRGQSMRAVLAAADALRREVNGDTVSYVVTRNINYTNVCYFKCGFCAFSKGKLTEALRGKPYLVPTEEILRRCHEAWDRGAVEVCLQGGIHPGFDRRLLRRGARGDQGGASRPARARLLGARGLAGGGDPRGAASRLPRAPARGRARVPSRNSGGDPRRRGPHRCSAPTRSIPSSGWRCTAPPTRSAFAPPRRSCTARSSGPTTGPGTSWPYATCRSRPAASPSSCRCPSCTWRPRST